MTQFTSIQFECIFVRSNHWINNCQNVLTEYASFVQLNRTEHRNLVLIYIHFVGSSRGYRFDSCSGHQKKKKKKKKKKCKIFSRKKKTQQKSKKKKNRRPSCRQRV
eukprot:530242_1